MPQVTDIKVLIDALWISDFIIAPSLRAFALHSIEIRKWFFEPADLLYVSRSFKTKRFFVHAFERLVLMKVWDISDEDIQKMSYPIFVAAVRMMAVLTEHRHIRKNLSCINEIICDNSTNSDNCPQITCELVLISNKKITANPSQSRSRTWRNFHQVPCLALFGVVHIPFLTPSLFLCLFHSIRSSPLVPTSANVGLFRHPALIALWHRPSPLLATSGPGRLVHRLVQVHQLRCVVSTVSLVKFRRLLATVVSPFPFPVISLPTAATLSLASSRHASLISTSNVHSFRHHRSCRPSPRVVWSLLHVSPTPILHHSL